jgi:hypothetical protein
MTWEEYLDGFNGEMGIWHEDLIEYKKRIIERTYTVSFTISDDCTLLSFRYRQYNIFRYKRYVYNLN